jgi:hypothetical protein
VQWLDGVEQSRHVSSLSALDHLCTEPFFRSGADRRFALLLASFCHILLRWQAGGSVVCRIWQSLV